MSRISEETKQKVIRLYRNKNITVGEIANLTNISLIYAYKILQKYRNNNTNSTNNINKRAISKKYTEEQEKEIAEDYYVNGLSTSMLKEKWNCHPMQLQVIRNKFGDLYGEKKYGRNANK